LYITLCLNEKIDQKWVKNWIANRNKFGHMSLLRELSANEPSDLKNYIRMSATDFNNLLDK